MLTSACGSQPCTTLTAYAGNRHRPAEGVLGLGGHRCLHPLQHLRGNIASITNAGVITEAKPRSMCSLAPAHADVRTNCAPGRAARGSTSRQDATPAQGRSRRAIAEFDARNPGRRPPIHRAVTGSARPAASAPAARPPVSVPPSGAAGCQPAEALAVLVLGETDRTWRWRHPRQPFGPPVRAGTRCASQRRATGDRAGPHTTRT